MRRPIRDKINEDNVGTETREDQLGVRRREHGTIPNIRFLRLFRNAHCVRLTYHG